MSTPEAAGAGGGGGRKRQHQRYHRGGGGGGGGDKRMRFGSAPANPAPFVTLQSLRKGRALLATCEVGRERQAGKELRVILERFVEQDKGKGEEAGDKEATAGGGSVREALQQEMEELRKAKGTGSAILPVDTGCKGTTGVSIPSECRGLDPVSACTRLLEEARDGHGSSRCLVKLMPLERICFAGDLENLKQELRGLLKERGVLLDVGAETREEGEEDSKPSGPAAAAEEAEAQARPTYMISLNRRNFHSHSREDLYRTLGEVIGTRWKVDLQNPQRVLVVEAIQGTIGFSLCARFGELKKYNLRQLQDQARTSRDGGGGGKKGGEGGGVEEAPAGAGAE